MKKIVSLALALWLLSAALSFCFVGLLEVQMVYASPYTDISVTTAHDMVTNGSYPNLVVLDVRNKSEYDGGHIYGAVWIPLANLTSRIGELSGHKNHEIIVYCKSGGRSATASGILDSNNFTKVYNMLDGIQGWQAEGYPVWNATVHNLNTTFNYDTIQAAISAPQTEFWHTIRVDAGTYYEHVTIYKSISLVGENRSTTVIDGNGTGNVIEITAHYVNVTGFTIRNGMNGTLIKRARYNIISGNIVTNNQHGINLFASCTCSPANRNIIKNNIIENNNIGVHVENSYNNVIFHNNFINNTDQAVATFGFANTWDDSYPSGGNYWSDYTGVDVKSGPNQDQPGSDGIGDTAYAIDPKDAKNQDNYPLMKPWSPLPIKVFDVVWEDVHYSVTTLSNSSLTHFIFNQTLAQISFKATGEPGTVGYCNVTIPNNLLWGDFTVLIDGDPPMELIRKDNATHISLYFTYELQSTRTVQVIGTEVIPEFPTWTSILLILIMLTTAIAIHKRRLPKTQTH